MQKNIDLIVRKFHGAYCIQCTRPMPGSTLYWSDTPYGDAGRPLGAMDGQERWVPSPDPNRRLYFCVQSSDGQALWAGDTAVEIHSVENFRDMGGYRTREGRTVKWGRFFRCGAVSGMNETETKIYEGMHIRSLFDYRSLPEAAQKPDDYTAETTYYAVPAITGGQSDLTDMDMVEQMRRIRTKADAEAIYDGFRALYRTLPFSNDAYRQMFAALDDAEAVPMIQHCSAGKDRTGIGCALLLLALGVDEATVLEDYLLSAIFRQRVNDSYVEKLAAAGLGPHATTLMARMLTVTPDMLQSALDAIHERYASFGDFLQSEYDITDARREKWVQMHTTGV